MHFSGGTAVGRYTLAGLDPLTSYQLTIFGSRNAGDVRTTRYEVTNGVDSFDSTLAVSGPVNNTEVVVLGGIASTAGGTIDLSLADNGSNTAFGYINAVRIDEVPEPASAALLGLGGLCTLARRWRSK